MFHFPPPFFIYIYKQYFAHKSLFRRGGRRRGAAEGAAAASHHQQGYDIIIRNGTIFDGLRTPRFVSDIGIRSGVVSTIGNIPSGTPCGREIDAKGKAKVMVGPVNVSVDVKDLKPA